MHPVFMNKEPLINPESLGSQSLNIASYLAFSASVTAQPEVEEAEEDLEILRSGFGDMVTDDLKAEGPVKLSTIRGAEAILAALLETGGGVGDETLKEVFLVITALGVLEGEGVALEDE